MSFPDVHWLSKRHWIFHPYCNHYVRHLESTRHINIAFLFAQISPSLLSAIEMTSLEIPSILQVVQSSCGVCYSRPAPQNHLLFRPPHVLSLKALLPTVKIIPLHASLMLPTLRPSPGIVLQQQSPSPVATSLPSLSLLPVFLICTTPELESIPRHVPHTTRFASVILYHSLTSPPLRNRVSRLSTGRDRANPTRYAFNVYLFHPSANFNSPSFAHFYQPRPHLYYLLVPSLPPDFLQSFPSLSSLRCALII